MEKIDYKQKDIEEILEWCSSLSQEELEVLTKEEISSIASVDTNWCESDADVSSAIFAMYEEIKGLI